MLKICIKIVSLLSGVGKTSNHYRINPSVKPLFTHNSLSIRNCLNLTYWFFLWDITLLKNSFEGFQYLKKLDIFTSVVVVVVVVFKAFFLQERILVFIQWFWCRAISCSIDFIWEWGVLFFKISTSSLCFIQVLFLSLSSLLSSSAAF